MSFGKTLRKWLFMALFVAGGLGTAAFSSPLRSVAAEGDAHEEVEADTSLVNASLTKSTKTDTCQSYEVTFSSPNILLMNNGSRYKSVYLAIDDEKWDGERTKAPDSSNLPEYNGYVFSIYPSSADKGDIIIPSVVTLASYFKINVVRISSNVLFDFRSGKDGAPYLKSITIPKTVTTIDDHAFRSLPEGVKINLEAEEPLEGYSNFMVEDHSVLNYNVSLDSLGLSSTELNRQINPSSSGSDRFGEGENVMLGYHGEGDLDLPLHAVFDIKDSEGVVERRDVDVPLAATNNSLFDAIGAGYASSLTLVVDFPLNKGETVLEETIVLHNIFHITQNEKGARVPDLSKGYLYLSPRIAFDNSVNVDDLVDIEISNTTSFAGFTQVNIRMKVEDDIYELVSPENYETHYANIQAGNYRVRLFFYALNQSFYRVTYKADDGSIKSAQVPVETPESLFEVPMGKDNKLGFIFQDSRVAPDFNADKMVAFEILSLTFRIDLLNVNTSGSAARVLKSDSALRFGALSLIDRESGNGKVSLSLLAIIINVSYFALAIIFALILFLYRKKKYKNDEFRRVVPKRYAKEAAKNIFGFGLLANAIMFIVFRWAGLDNSIVTFNPTDVFVIVFAVAGGIFLGLFIKEVVASVKDSRKRKEAMRLKLDQDVADDGTN